MFRHLRDLLLGQDSYPFVPGTAAMENPPEAEQAKTLCLFLDKIPPEIRVRVYEYLVTYPYRLAPCSTLKGTESFTTSSSSRRKHDEHAVTEFRPVDTTIFLLNRQIYEEAADVFYSSNRFCVHFDYICTCWNNKQTVRLNEKMIKHFKITGVNFETQDHEPMFWERCKTCATDGFALVKYLNSLPNLRSIVIAFGDIESFASCAAATTRKLRKLGKTASLQSLEVGRLQIRGTKALIELRLPVLHRRWPVAMKTAPVPQAVGDSESDDEDFDVDEGSESECGPWSARVGAYVDYALGDILHHAVVLNLTTPELRPFMQKALSPSGLHLEHLDAREHAAFTVALVECLGDIIDDENEAIVEMADRQDLVQLATFDENVGTTESKDA